jgi:hypothetical protein
MWALLRKTNPSSRRRGDSISKHKRSWNENILAHVSRRGPKPEMTVLERPSNNCLHRTGLIIPSSGIWRRVLCWVATNVSEEHISSIFRVEEIIQQEPASKQVWKSNNPVIHVDGCRTSFFSEVLATLTDVKCDLVNIEVFLLEH